MKGLGSYGKNMKLLRKKIDSFGSDAINEEEYPFFSEEQVKRFHTKTSANLNDVMLAAFKASEEANLRLIMAGGNFRYTTNDHMISVMHLAAMNKRYGLLLVVLYALFGLDPYIRDVDGDTPVDFALYGANFETAAQLLDLKRFKLNILQYCVLRHNLVLVKKVLQADPGLIGSFSRKDERNAFHLAAQYSDWDMCKAIADAAADEDASLIEARCRRGCTVMHYAGLNRQNGADLVVLFAELDLGLDERDRKGYTPLHYALIDRNFNTARKMIDMGADCNAKITRQGGRPRNLLSVLLIMKRFKSVQFLHRFNHGAIRKARVEGLSALHYSVKTANLRFVRWLVEVCGFDPNEICKVDSGNALHNASTNKRHGAQIVAYLAGLGLDVNRKEKRGLCPMHVAFQSDNHGVVRALINCGADLDVLIKGKMNYLHCCVSLRALNCAKVVHENRKYLIHEYLGDGRGVLHLAARSSSVDMVCWLYMNGAVKQIYSKAGKLPSVYANPSNTAMKQFLLAVEKSFIDDFLENYCSDDV